MLVKLCNLDYNVFVKLLIGRRTVLKKYIANNWMKLLRIGGYVALILLAFFKLNTPKTLIPDYIKYGKDIAPIGTTASGDTIAGAVGSFFGGAFSGISAIDPKLTLFVVGIMGAILLIVFLHMLMDKKADKKKK